MGRYLLEGASTPQAYAAMIKDLDKGRAQMIAGLLEKKGGKLLDYYVVGGITRSFIIFELPDPVDPLAIQSLYLAFYASGGFTSVSVTPVFTADETVEAAKRAPEWGYRPPSA